MSALDRFYCILFYLIVSYHSDIDECEDSTACDPNADCTDVDGTSLNETFGTRNCTCRDGWSTEVEMRGEGVDTHALICRGRCYIKSTLKVESFTGRNFRDFANFLVVRENLYPRNSSFQVVRESLYPQNFLKF